MAYAAKAAYGATISVAGTAVAGVRSIDGPDVKAETFSATALGETHVTKMRNRPDSGQVTMEVNLDLTVHSTLLASLDSNKTITHPTPLAIVLTFSDGTKFTFSAYVTGFKPTVVEEGQPQMFTLTLDITGSIATDDTA